MVANITTIYIINYIILIIILYIILSSKRSFTLLTKVSLTTYLNYIGKYSDTKKIVNIIFLILAGLAPSSNFFIKMIIFIFLLKSANFFSCFIYFLVIAINTTYYLQAIYIHEKIKIDVKTIYKIMECKDHKNPLKDSYIFWFLTFLYFIINFLFIIFNADFIIILMLN